MVSNSILFAVIIILVIAAIGDIKHRRIPNLLSLLLVALYGAFALSIHLQGGDVAFMGGLIAGGGVLAGGFVLFAMGAMGGGDVKLAAAIALFAGSKYIIGLLILISLFGGLVAGFTWLYSKRTSKENKVDGANRHSVPYGVAISISGLWLCIQLLDAVSFALE